MYNFQLCCDGYFDPRLFCKNNNKFCCAKSIKPTLDTYKLVATASGTGELRSVVLAL